MLSFTPTADQQMLIDTLRRFSEDEVRAMAHDADESGELPAEILSTGWEMGVLPGNMPEDLGGFADEYSVVTGALAYEELAYGDLAFALRLMTPALVAVPIMVSGTDTQKDEFLDLFLDEAPPAVTAALIEKRITFDPRQLHTTATPHNGGFVLNGQKAYVPLAEGAAWILVYAANTESGRVDAFLVRGDAAGVTVGPREKLMGVRALPTYPVTLENVEVEAAHRLGGDEGIDYDRLLAHSQVALGALAVGVMRGALDFAINYAKEREQFGAPIATKQAIAFMLAECAMEVDSARLMVWEAAWQLDQGQDATRAAYLAKQYADRAALMVTDSAVQVLGGYGYIREFPVERWLRNARGFATFDGLAMV